MQGCSVGVSLRALVLAASLAACQAMPTSGDPLAPVKVSAPPPPAAAPADPTAPPAPTTASAPGQPVSGFDFLNEDRKPDDEQPVESDAVALQARYLGVDPALLRAASPAPAAAAPPLAPTMPTIGAWDPTKPLPGGFGVHLLATMHDLQPPMAVIGLPDGTQQVVHPGDILAQQQVVIMAIGRDLVQVARFTPEGYYARVDTENVQALFPTAQRPPAMP